MKKRDDLFLREIDNRAARIERHLKKVSHKKFLSSELHRSAVVRELEVIGEASKQISDEIKKKFSEIPRAKIAGMRVKDQKLPGKGKGFARGLMQITDQTRAILADEKGELKDYYFTLTPQDVKEPTIAIAAAIRWLFHKRELASKYLKRKATWEEAVAEYKAYLRKKKPWKEQKGMKVFAKNFEKLKGKKK